MVQIHPDKIPIELVAPISKSHLQRELLISLCANEPTVLEGNFSNVPDDALHALGVIKALGCKVVETSYHWQIIPPINRLKAQRVVLKVGESGFLFRSLLSIGFLFAEELELHAEGSLLTRKLPTLAEDLKALGANCLSAPNQWPMILSKKDCWSHTLVLNASGTSQVASGVLMMMGASKDVNQLILLDLVSRPYLDFTLRCLENRGLKVLRNLDQFTIESVGYLGGRLKIQGDWSGAANWLCLGAMSGRAVVHGLALNSSQADERVLEVLQMYGAKIYLENGSITVEKKSNQPFEVDLTDSPDLFPLLSVLAASATGESRLVGISRLASKESNRLTSTEHVLNALGVVHQTEGNSLRISGGMNYLGATIDSFRDHRIILATMVAAKFLNVPIALSSSKEVSKSIKGLNFS